MNSFSQGLLSKPQTRQTAATCAGLIGAVVTLCGDIYIMVSIIRFLSGVAVGSTIRPMGFAMLVGMLSYSCGAVGITSGIMCISMDWNRARNWILGLTCIALGAMPLVGAAPLIRWMCISRHLTIAG
jgi:hypothetical protein